MKEGIERSRQAATRLAALVAKGEIAEPGLFAPDARGWHNTDELWAPMSDAPLRMGAVRAMAPDFHAVEITTHPFAGGFAMQYAFVGSMTSGEKLRIVGCIVAAVDSEGRITKVQEYVDSAQAAPLIAALEKLAAG